jgi:hypothetical protein
VRQLQDINNLHFRDRTVFPVLDIALGLFVNSLKIKFINNTELVNTPHIVKYCKEISQASYRIVSDKPSNSHQVSVF